MNSRGRRTYVSSSHRRDLRVCIIRGCDLDDVRRDNVQAVQPPQDSAQLARRPTARLRRARCWSRCRVKRVNLVTQKISLIIWTEDKDLAYVDGEVDWQFANCVPDPFDDAVRT